MKSKKKYATKPNFEKYKKNIKKSSPEVRKELYKIQKNIEKNYNKDKAKIAMGEKESKIKYKTKEVSGKLNRKLKQLAKSKVVSRRIFKNEQTVVNIPDYKAPSVLGDPNRFFNKEMEETKRSMFFQ